MTTRLAVSPAQPPRLLAQFRLAAQPFAFPTPSPSAGRLRARRPGVCSSRRCPWRCSAADTSHLHGHGKHEQESLHGRLSRSWPPNRCRGVDVAVVAGFGPTST
jgi:hypothetical protein